MKCATRMLALTLTLLPILAVAQLNGSDKMTASVPFPVRVADKLVPAGEWTLQSTNMGARTLVVRNIKAKTALVVDEASPVETRNPAAHCALVFHKYGERYFLAAIRIEGDRTIYRLRESAQEAELRAQNSPSTETTLLASLK